VVVVGVPRLVLAAGPDFAPEGRRRAGPALPVRGRAHRERVQVEGRVVAPVVVRAVGRAAGLVVADREGAPAARTAMRRRAGSTRHARLCSPSRRDR
jgi:hypothetical protein